MKKLGNIFTSHILWLKFITNYDKVLLQITTRFLQIATTFITNYDKALDLKLLSSDRKEVEREFAVKTADE